MTLFFQWLCVAAAGYIATVIYSLVVGTACFFLDHEGLEEMSLGPVLFQSWKYGSLAAILVAPLLGVSVLKDANESIENPDQETKWWVRAQKQVLVTFAVIAGGGVLLGIVWLSLGGLTTGVLIGSMLGAAVMTLGPLMGGGDDEP